MIKGCARVAWAALVALALTTPAIAAPDSGKEKLQDVIITVRPGSQASVRKRLAAQGLTVAKEHGLVRAMTVSVDARGRLALENDPDIEWISSDAEVTPSDRPGANNPAETPVLSNLKKTLGLSNEFSGANVTVAVIDSGISETADFTGRIVGTFDFTNNKISSVQPIDEYGHGTHVAGLIGASGAVSNGYFAGVAPAVKLLSLRVLDKKGSGRTSNVIAALEFAVANRDRFNIRVINLSLGHPIFESATTDPLVRAVEAAVRAGIVVVTASGNLGTNPLTGKVGYAGITSPGNAPSALTVGAASNNGTIERRDDRVASYSSRGPSWFDGYGKPDVVAPGSGLLSDVNGNSTLATTYPALVYPTAAGKLMKLSGSSMASGVVSGLVAVMMDAHDVTAQQRYEASLTGRAKKVPYVPVPALSPNAVKAILQYSATTLRDATGARYDALTQGAGEVDGSAAVTLASLIETEKPAGTPWLGLVIPVTQFGWELDSWSQSVVWGTRLVSGPGLIEINQGAWSQSVVWGSGELNNIVWGTLSTEGDNIVWGTTWSLPDVVWAGSVREQDNIVWGTAMANWSPNIVWGTAVGLMEGDNIVWGTAAREGDNIVWGTLRESDNIVWGTSNKVLGLVLTGGIQ